MSLSEKAAHSWFPVPHNYKEILNNKAIALEFVDNLNMSQPLLICANLILTF